MDTSDSTNHKRSLLRSKSSKLKIDDVPENDLQSSSEKKKIKQAPAISSTKRTHRKKATTYTKRKINQPKTSNGSGKTPVHTGLNGNYWNITPVNRHINQLTFNQSHRDRDDDSLSESESVTRRKNQKRLVSTSSSSSSSSSISSIDLQTARLYSNKTFITCRSPADSFFLCQVLQDVHHHTKKIRIRWCSLADGDENETEIDENTRFKLDYEDKLDPHTILTEITHVIRHADKTVSLTKQDIIETNLLLKKSINGESMDLTRDNNRKQPTRKRRKITSDEAAPVRKRRRTKDIDEAIEGEKKVVKQKPASKKTTRKPVTISKAQLFKVQSNRFLKENLTVTVYQTDPFFEDNLPVPFISSSIQSKLAIRAVLLNDRILLNSLIDDVDRVCSVHIRRDFSKSLSAIHYAIKNDNIDLLRILLEDIKKPKQNRAPFPEVTMKKQSTGKASIRTLGFRTAEIMASRGAREGNNALIKDTNEVIDRYNAKEIIVYAIENNCSREIYDLLCENFNSSYFYDSIFECIQTGHRKFAVRIIDSMTNMSSYGFKTLFHEVLRFDQEDLTVDSACDVIEKLGSNAQMTPIHCAAINPNSKYLKQLLSIVPEPNIKDKYERKPIHFAAACEGPEPLEYLLSKNVNINDVDNGGNSPLHIAVKNDRAMNAQVLLRAAKEKSESNDTDDQAAYEKFGLASINQMNRSRYYPLHLAVLNNHLDCVKVLLEFGARIDGFTTISTEKLTPLMLACQNGFLPIVHHLIEQGAKVEARDRFKRTPLIHACMYGNAHVVSHLLRIGANANVFDSSSNTALHYAIAYGWYFCVRLLIEAGANINCVNCWQTTCLGVGFSKGHYGICDYLLTEHRADINFKTDDGLTLVMITADLEISASAAQQLEYVVVKHKADCTCIDINGRNAFHYLALNQIEQTLTSSNQKEQQILRKHYFRMAQILLDHNCNPLQMDNKAQTSLMLALESKNFILVDFFINEAKLELNSDVSRDGKTLLHYFAINCDNDKLIQTLISLPVTDEFRKMGKMLDNQGRTPFHYCISRYDEFCKGNRSYGVAAVQQQYNSIVNMIQYCLETIGCDPDLEIKSIEDKTMPPSKPIDDGSNENVTVTEEALENIEETSIFYLLRTFDQTFEHPLEIFLKKTKNVNVRHHQTRRTPLLEAIHLREYKTVSMLMRHSSCDINLATSINPSERQQTPLIVACKLQFLSTVRDLLNHSKCDLIAYDNQHNQALHYYLAISIRSDEYIEIFHLFIEKLKLIDKNTLSSPGKSSRTPLHIAVYHNSGTVDTINDIEQTLIDNECNLLMKDDLGNLPLHNIFLVNKSGGDPVELCVLIVQAMKYNALDTKNNEGNTPLHLAVIKASTVCVMLLLKHHASLLVENNLSNSVLTSCIVSNHLNLLITFLHQPVDIDLSRLYTKSGGSASCKSIELSKAADDKELWAWQFAIVSKNKPDEKNSLIHLIIQRNWQGALSLILDELDRFHLRHIQVFEAAILNDRLNLVLRLGSSIKDRTVLDEKNSHGRNLFHIIANIQQCDTQLLEKILNYLHSNHVDWNVPDNYGSYPLHYACVIQNTSFINFLEKKYLNELDFNQTDSFGNTAYSLLFWFSATKSSFDKEFFRKLITSGKSIDCLCNYDNEISMNPLSFDRINASSGNISLYPPVTSEHSSTKVRSSPLINAIVHNHFELAKFLLELGADVNFPDEEKRTPLMHAVRQNNIHMVKLLLNKLYIPTDDNQWQKDTDFILSRQKVKKPKSKGFFLGVTTASPCDHDDSDDDISDETETLNKSDTFTVTSMIDINASDVLGYTCIHHLVQPFPDGSYINNIRLLELLHSSGASLTQPDLANLSPLQHSAINGCQHLCHKLKELMNKQQTDLTQVKVEHFHVNDPNRKLLGVPDYYSGAQEFINQYISSHASINLHTAYQVDPLSNMSQTGEIVMDTEKNEPYDVRLTITDVDYGLIGLYNFYRMQIIKHKSKTNLYLLFTRWGRIGDGDGQHQLTPFSSLDECQKEFCKVFRQKTGNSWKDTDQFQTKPKKYTLIKLNERQMQKYTNVPIDFQQLQDDNQHPPSKLQSSIYKNFFKTFLNPQAIRTNLQKTELDVEWMPISQLRPETLQKARDILVQLNKDIEQKEKLKLTIQQSQCTEPKEKVESETQQTINDVQKSEFKCLLDSICKLTNEYYTIIPLQGYGDERLPMIDSVQAVKVQEQKLDDLVELELSCKILLAAQANLNQISPLDYLYKSINCQFEAMNKNDIDSQLILRYIWTSASHINVEQIFKIARPNDDKHLFQQNLENHYLLWHGTNICNLISILTRGLLVGPLCATATGSLFGKGIYTADAFAKSLGYCSGVRQNNNERCFMLLCEVALGNSQEVGSHNVDLNQPLDLKIHQSRKANGRKIPDPQYTVTRKYGVQMPLGQLINCTDPKHNYHTCEYNEYIVFDESQIALRYLVQFRR
ncbi:unnamed protein product [Rotaria magnacalcarata]|uniref:Poly [ADP-ribose] polymerase n=1 Tax=Rotaria magnacalcarata TaxID=392030 RepID=A0A816M402_9BILA|nr:unnamed protein product [Rotaria magnacalcarata]